MVMTPALARRLLQQIDEHVDLSGREHQPADGVAELKDNHRVTPINPNGDGKDARQNNLYKLQYNSLHWIA
jgi:hypothetical protein